MSAALAVELFGTTFQNPVLLAAGTCGFGREVAGVVALEELGGLVTKSVTLAPRSGNPAPRVAEFEGGMLNSIGLANPGLEGARTRELPWIRERLRSARVFVSVAGHTPEEYETVVSGLESEGGFLGFELNLSCPNDRRLDGLPFALDPEALAGIVGRCRAATERPLLVKLAPNDPALAGTVEAAEGAGADGITLVNTLPALELDVDGRASLGAGQGGMSGPALRPVALRAVAVARAATALPLVGVGGVVTADHVVGYLRAGADLVQMGTASFADPRAAERAVRRLPAVLARSGHESIESLRRARERAPGTTRPRPDGEPSRSGPPHGPRAESGAAPMAER